MRNILPIFQQTTQTDPSLWAAELLGFARRRNIHTTTKIKEEVQAVWKRWNAKSRKDIAKMYNRIFREIEIVDIYSDPEDGQSAADVSLKERRHNELLVTSDCLLYEKDMGPTVFLQLTQKEYFTTPFLKITKRKGTQNAE